MFVSSVPWLHHTCLGIRTVPGFLQPYTRGCDAPACLSPVKLACVWRVLPVLAQADIQGHYQGFFLVNAGAPSATRLDEDCKGEPTAHSLVRLYERRLKASEKIWFSPLYASILNGLRTVGTTSFWAGNTSVGTSLSAEEVASFEYIVGIVIANYGRRKINNTIGLCKAL